MRRRLSGDRRGAWVLERNPEDESKADELRPVVEAEPGLVLQSPASAPELTDVSAAA